MSSKLLRVAVALVVEAGVIAPAAQAASPRSVALKVSLAAIVESPTTVGVADSALYFDTAADMKKQLDLLKNAGVTSVRIAVPWVFVQPTGPDVYDLTKVDQMVSLAKADGMSIVAAMNQNPAWDGLVGAGNPDDAALAAFASAVATRYRGQIDAYEVWNEPNAALFYAPVDPAAYAADLKAAYRAIKSADPDAMVIGGVLAATQTVPGVTMAAPDFLRGMYAAGAAGYFDALSYHPYGWGYLPFSKGAGVADAPLQQISQLRLLMVANGDGAKKIWATEYGNATTPLIGVSDAQQAGFLKDFVTAWQSVEGAGPAYLYTTRDIATGTLDAENNYGLWRTDWSTKPAALALTDLETQLHSIAAGTASQLNDPTYTYGGIPDAQAFFSQVAGLAIGVANALLAVPRALLTLLSSAVGWLGAAVGQVVQAVFSPAASARPAASVRTADPVPSVRPAPEQRGARTTSTPARATPKARAAAAVPASRAAPKRGRYSLQR